MSIHGPFIYSILQRFIDEPEREWTEEELPAISDGYSISQIKQTVLNLHKVFITSILS